MIQFTPYVLLLAGMSVTTLVLIVLTFQCPAGKRPPEAPELAWLLVLIGFAVCCLTLEYAFISFDQKLFWGTVRFVTFAFLPPAVLRLYMRFTTGHRFGVRALVLLHIVPMFTLGAVLTNPWHEYFWTTRTLVEQPFVSFVYNYSGPFFWVHSAYSYAILLAAYWALLAGILKKPRIYRGQGYIMLAGACVSLFINVLYIFDLYTALGDLTMPAMFVTAVCLYWAIFLHKPAKMIRLARALAVSELGTPVLIFDDRNLLIDVNQSAAEAFGFTSSEAFNKLTSSAFLERLGFAADENLDGREICLTNGTENHYSVMDRTLDDEKSLRVGRFMVFNNITRLKNTVRKLEFSNTHDRFTGMFNRNVFQSELKKIDKPENLPIAMVSLNIYGMKFLNTVYGYEFGDRMIKLAADAVTAHTAERGLCARFSGDEFVAALCNTTEKEAAEFIKNVKETANRPPAPDVKKQGSFAAHISLSSGISVKENRAENIDLVFKNAVSRMLRSKLLDAKTRSAELFDFMKNTLQNNQYETAGHVERIQSLSQRMAERMNFTPAQCENMRLLSLAHNIGILGTPVDLIKKTGSLSNEEWEEVRLHTVRGYNIAMLFPDLTPIAEDILRHHERYDGLGYPDGLQGEDIPLSAQIILLVNYYDGLTYPWPQEKPLTEAEAVDAVKKQAGAMFSPALVEAFTDVIGKEPRGTIQTVVRPEDDAELAEILKLLDMD